MRMIFLCSDNPPQMNCYKYDPKKIIQYSKSTTHPVRV